MKYIKITEDRKRTALQEFAQFLTTERTLNNEIKYTCKLDDVDTTNVVKPKLFFTATAWLKMTLLVQTYASEVAWHGVVERIDREKYLVTDILVYPQTVTGVTVSSEDDAYPSWCIALDDDVANKLRFQGHSHVHMHTSPSGTDLTYYENILNTLKEDSWYFFMILNKKGDFWLQCHDFAQNIIFENTDISVSVLLDDDTTHNTWLAEAQTLVKEKTWTKTTYCPAQPSLDRRYDINDPYSWDDETHDPTRYTQTTPIRYTQAAPTAKQNKKNKKAQKQTKNFYGD